jgi:hypothetical protein
MRNFLLIIFLFVVVLLAANGSFAQKTKAKPKPTPTPAKPATVAQIRGIDLGRLRGNTYTNDFFGLKFDFPLGWLVGDNELEKQLKAIEQEQIKTKDAQTQKAIQQAIERVTPLLGGYKKLPGMPGNASLRVMVEDLSAQPLIADGKAYLTLTVDSLKLAKMPADFKYSEVKSEVIDNVTLDYIETSTGGYKKRIYAAVRKKFALLMTIDYYENADFETLHKILSEADLNYKR